METFLIYVHPPIVPCPDLPGPVDAQRLRENDVGKYKEPLGVPTTVEYNPPLRVKYGRKLAP